MTSDPARAVGDVHRQMVRGTAWIVLMRTVVRLIGLMNTILLVRLLDPTDFGIVAMAFFVIGLLQSVLTTDVDSALVRAASVTREQYDVAWTINILAGLVLSVLFGASAPFVASFFNEPRAEWVMLVLAIQPAISGFENIGTLNFRRNLEFHKEFLFWTTKKLSGVLLGFSLALYFRDYRALAIAFPVAAAATVVLTFVMSPYRPRLRFKGAGELWTFSKWMFLANLGIFGVRRGDTGVVGRTTSSEVLGHYTVASDVTYIPLQELFESVGRALLPTYGILQNRPTDLHATFWRVLGLTAIGTISISTGLMIVSSDLVLVLLGETWIPSVGFFRWLAFCAAGVGFIYMLKDMFMVMQLERIFGLLQLAAAIVGVTIWAITGAFLDATAVAASRALSLACFGLALLLYLARLTNRSPVAVLSILWRPVISAMAMAMVVGWTHGFLTVVPLISLIVDTIAGALVFSATILGLWAISGRPPGSAESTLLSLSAIALSRVSSRFRPTG